MAWEASLPNGLPSRTDLGCIREDASSAEGSESMPVVPFYGTPTVPRNQWPEGSADPPLPNAEALPMKKGLVAVSATSDAGMDRNGSLTRLVVQQAVQPDVPPTDSEAQLIARGSSSFFLEEGVEMANSTSLGSEWGPVSGGCGGPSFSCSPLPVAILPSLYEDIVVGGDVLRSESDEHLISDPHYWSEGNNAISGLWHRQHLPHRGQNPTIQIQGGHQKATFCGLRCLRRSRWRECIDQDLCPSWRQRQQQ